MFSFKINKKTTNTSAPATVPKGSKRAFNDDDERQEEELDFIDGLDGNSIISKKQKKVENKVLVIPLITKNKWRIDNKLEDTVKQEPLKDRKDDNEIEDSKQASETVLSEGELLKQQAIKELLEGSSDEKADAKNSTTIPLLFQNRVPDGYEEDDNMDVSLRPDQSTLDDYERVPIDQFGMALLRGMGWKETEGIGLKNKKVVDMLLPKLRPKGMGLGAEATSLNKDVAPTKLSKSTDEKEDLSFKIGAYGIITRGSKKGYYGQIESFDEDNNRVIMRLGISGKMEAVSKFYINIVSSKEYKKNSKVINSEKYEEYKKKHENKKHKEQKRDSKRDGSDNTSESDDEKEYEHSNKSKHHARNEDRDYKSDKKNPESEDKKRSHKKAEKDKKYREDKNIRSYSRNRNGNRHRRDESESDEDEDSKRSYGKHESRKSEYNKRDHRRNRDRDHKRRHSSRD